MPRGEAVPPSLMEQVIGLAIEVHRKTGPGLFPVNYKGVPIPLGFRADILVAATVILEVKAVPVRLQGL
jgi:hypothetical protein